MATNVPLAIPISKLQTFPQLSPAAFQHPDDVKATFALQNVPGISAVVKAFAGGVVEKAARLNHLSECIRVGPCQAVHLYRVFVKAAEILSVPTLPEIFISSDAGVNAYAMGMKQHTVVVTRGLIEDMTVPEVMAVFGHELGHVKCNHMVNKTIASMIAEFGLAGISRLVPVVGEAALLPVLAHLQYWSRRAEMSCDRAALLVVQDPKVVASMLAKLGGWPKSLGDIDFQSLREQGEEYDKLDNDKVSAVLKIINTLQSELYLTHPLPIDRVRKILLWGESDMYREILADRPVCTGDPLCRMRHAHVALGSVLSDVRSRSIRTALGNDLQVRTSYYRSEGEVLRAMRRAFRRRIGKRRTRLKRIRKQLTCNTVVPATAWQLLCRRTCRQDVLR